MSDYETPTENIDVFFERIQSRLKTMSPEELQNNLYTTLRHLCQVWSAFSESNGEQGWSSTLPFTPEQQQTLEETFAAINKGEGEAGEPEQKGGGGAGASTGTGAGIGPSFAPGGALVAHNTNSGTQATGDDGSIDAAFRGFLNKLGELDLFWNTFSRENPGIYKLVTSGSTPIPIGPAPIPVPNTAIFTLIQGILESIRMLLSVAPVDFAVARYCITVLVMIEDAITGNWRQLLLNCLGFYSQFGMFLSVTGRLVLNAWLFMNPQIRTNIVYDMYKGFKSVLLGMLLWSFVTFTPEPLKSTILEGGLAQVRTLASSIDGQIETLKSAANPVLAPSGYELQIKLDTDTLKQITVDDIQNLQTLATWGQFICAAEVQAVLQPLYSDPIFRVIVELMGVPASKEDLQGVCGASFQKPLAEVMKDLVEVVPAVETKASSGGGRRRRTRRWRIRGH